VKEGQGGEGQGRARGGPGEGRGRGAGLGEKDVKTPLTCITSRMESSGPVIWLFLICLESTPLPGEVLGFMPNNLFLFSKYQFAPISNIPETCHKRLDSISKHVVSI
jgi:hypothetical protein